MNRKILMASFLLANCLIANPKYGVSLTNEGDQLRGSLARQAPALSRKNSTVSNGSFLTTPRDSSSFSSGDSSSLTGTPALSRKSSIKTLSDEESPNLAPQNNVYSLRFPAKFANTDEGYAEFVVATAVAFNDYMKKIKKMDGVIPEEHGGVYTPEMLVNKT
ncbi:hypothetical protein DAPPUDRAFT_100117 [Daphnia pulex]|uniref:JmjN domain-containing protein n=1 Tax=Daphnia pulex TaxID=6669 RepID=E9G9E6_DAPPU|nr:hypothetical protein DAPPUDRAFT_100117 [Daphnia pulex]|eukprot:EFX83888.1 hypothetical protein DAPPUDRAFT_100117 [Daphnia pulex]